MELVDKDVPLVRCRPVVISFSSSTAKPEVHMYRQGLSSLRMLLLLLLLLLLMRQLHEHLMKKMLTDQLVGV